MYLYDRNSHIKRVLMAVLHLTVTA